MRFFNTAGPVVCERHYCLPPLERLDLDEALMLIEQWKYFVLHAPRQTGKTSCLLALMKFLNRRGDHRCLYANLESAQAARENVRDGVFSILQEMSSRARDFLDDRFMEENRHDVFQSAGPYAALNEMLTLWAKASPKPLVVLLDEIDSLVGDTLISVLRQLRAGYDKRPEGFPQTIILCGVRDVRDYRIHSETEKAVITGGSAFNIKAESLRVGNFIRKEMEALYRQHTEETGQEFTGEALDSAWELTRGQPWLVNALAYEACFKTKESRERSRPVTAAMLDEAKEHLILRRETHLDQLADKLREDRVRRVVEPILAGESFESEFRWEDVQYVLDLGLLVREPGGALHVANRIYREVIPRELTWGPQTGMTLQAASYIAPGGLLDMDRLLAAFQEFFREHSEHWLQRFDYREAGPQLLLQAFLQRIVNSGGRVEREYGLGRMRTDLLVIWPCEERIQKVVVELKVLRKSLEKTVADGLEQTFEYMDRCGAVEGHLVVFDRRAERSWEEKIFSRRESYRGKEIGVWGM